MNIYIAARYSKKHDAQAFAMMVRTAVPDIRVVSRWHTQDEGEEGEADVLRDPVKGRVYAQRDIDDIEACDVLVLFAEDPLQGYPRGGRHVEFGYALALGKVIVVIGQRENIFHTLPEITVVQTSWDAIRILQNPLQIAR